MASAYAIFLAISRILIPCLAILLAVLWVSYYRSLKTPRPTLARFVTRDQHATFHLTAAEGIIGRRKTCDVWLPAPNISKAHAVVYQKNGGWFLAPADGEVWVNEKEIHEETAIMDGDLVAFDREELFFECNLEDPEDVTSETPHSGLLPLLILTAIQLLMGMQLWLRYWEDPGRMVPLGFGLLLAAEWGYFGLSRLIKPARMVAELPVLFLMTLGLAVCIRSAPDSLTKQFLCCGVGLLGYFVLTLLLRHPGWCRKLRWPAAVATLGALWFTVLFGTRIYGSRNWLTLGGFSVQPSEFAKVTFIFIGAACLYETLQNRKNDWWFLVFAAGIMGSLVLMVDFGAIAVFFVTLLVLLAMRLTDTRWILAICAGAALAGVVALLLFPHIAARFATWMHAWDVPNDGGYQQTRTMIAVAAGGLLGLGGGNGNLVHIAAADTDLVFGVISEEWGGIMALCATLCFAALGLYARHLARTSDSAFHAIGVCAAAGLMIFQTALNLFGSTDLLPLTGVTMMFVSRGGTSLTSAFWLMAFFKAAEKQPHPLETERRRYY